MSSDEDKVRKAEQPGIDAMKMHPFYKGKIETILKCCVRDYEDFGIWYTPGVAKPCLDIRDNPDKVFEHTNKGNFVAVISDGTRVLGLGDIGPEAAMPVMEGKALLFKYLGGIDAFPICIDTKDKDEIIKFVLQIQPCFGGVNLEDLSQPKCFDILDTLRKKARIPIWHDDQQGTAAVTVAGLINALKVVEKKIGSVKVGMVGCGAANVRIAHLLFQAGVDPRKTVICDTKGTLHRGRTELPASGFPQKWELAQMTNGENIVAEREDALPAVIEGTDVLVALSKSGPGVIEKEWITRMRDDAVVFVCANPVPEIWPWEAKEAGARIVATGRSDFPNQVNNSLGFPGIFRGILDVQARTITDEMCLAASIEVAKVAEDKGLSDEYIIPTMDEWEVFPREATAVGLKAIEQGVARLKLTREELFQTAEYKIKSSREKVQKFQELGFIKRYQDTGQ
jgi:malate dehydrogenase (oxaloacetate-decarboxylating)